QGLANNATDSAPVVYTTEDGTQVYKSGNTFYTDAARTAGNEVNTDQTPIITSVQSADGSTTKATKLSNVAAGTKATDAVNKGQL
ncbi:hypothetical protein, partial [Psychrobacter pygoscelis]